MSKVQMIGNITKITKTGGKAFAQVIMQIPVNKIDMVPTGEVNISIEASQSDVFDAIESGKRK